MHPEPRPGALRAQAISRLRGERLDTLIVGGGINGAGIARDLALRARHSGTPFPIGLVEQAHFGSGTSGRNSHLIHGGLRYLKHLEFRLVREALAERATLLSIAPHLVEPLAFLLPMYRRRDALFYGAGLRLYDGLSAGRRVGRHGSLSRAEVEDLEPGLRQDGLLSAAVFYDCRVHAARFVLENVLEASSNGVAAANYVRAVRWSPSSDGWEVTLEDVLTGEHFSTRARKLVDAQGAWSRAGELRLVRGSHLVLPRLNKSDYAVCWFEESGRIVFFIPWGTRREFTLLGTTDVDHRSTPDDVRISHDETSYLLGVAARMFPNTRDLTPVSSFSSLRPLIRDGSASPRAVSREHRIWNSEDGILHVAGGKYTTYRLMSEQAADIVCSEVAPPLERVRLTASTPLEGGSQQALAILAVHPPGDPAAIEWIVAREMAERLADVMFVSTYWGYERRWTRDSLLQPARTMAALLDWDAARIEAEISAVLERASGVEAAA